MGAGQSGVTVKPSRHPGPSCGACVPKAALQQSHQQHRSADVDVQNFEQPLWGGLLECVGFPDTGDMDQQVFGFIADGGE